VFALTQDTEEGEDGPEGGAPHDRLAWTHAGAVGLLLAGGGKPAHHALGGPTAPAPANHLVLHPPGRPAVTARLYWAFGEPPKPPLYIRL
jgi:hypothetical protein